MSEPKSDCDVVTKLSQSCAMPIIEKPANNRSRVSIFPEVASRAMNGVSSAMKIARTKISSPLSIAVKPSTPCVYCGKITMPA